MSVDELGRADVERLHAAADGYREGRGRHHDDAVIGLLFFEDSLRTQVGFDTAAARLGARTTVVRSTKQTAVMGRAETVADTVRSIASWCDALCVRHPDAAELRRVSELTTTPVINCGGGRDEHPTQAIIDLYALSTLRGAVDGVTIGIVGDLNGMRTAHSLAVALSLYDRVSVRCISPAGLELPEQYLERLRARGHSVESSTELDAADLDVLYVAGLPAPTAIGTVSAATQSDYRVTTAVVQTMSADALVFSPLPRIDEIDPDVDELPQAAYFRQSELALAARMAILDDVLTRARS